VLLVSVCPLLCLSAEEPIFTNLDFSNGLDGWGAWSGTKAHRWVLDKEVGHGGKSSLRIEADSRKNNVMVLTTTTRMKPGQRYGFEMWWRFEKMSLRFRSDFRVIFRDADGKWITGIDLNPHFRKPEGDWFQTRYRMLVPDNAASTTVGIWVRETKGIVRVSGMSLSLIPAGQRSLDSMYLYDPFQVKLGPVPLQNFRKLKSDKSPFLSAAKRWNELLVAAGFMQEDLCRARRALLYTRRPDDLLSAHDDRARKVLADLDDAYQRLGRLYDKSDSNRLAAEFIPSARKVEKDIRDARAGLKSLVDEARPSTKASEWLKIPEVDTGQPWWDAERKRARYVFWTRWSNPEQREMEMPLRLGDGQTLTVGRPKDATQGICDWSNYLDQAKTMHDAGARRFSLITHYSLHDKGYLSREFAEKNKSDPDITMMDNEGKPMAPRSGLCHFNWLNPKVRSHMVDVLTQMAKFFKERKEYQFYVTSWEGAGPYCRQIRIGNNPSHKEAFRKFLKQRYGNITALNAKWRTDYESSDAISPQPEEDTPTGAPATPRLIESRRWAQEAYVDYLKLIRDTIHRIDPTKPIIGEHSGLLDRVISPRIYDSVDLLGYHRRAGTTMPVQVWMSSLQRHTGKCTGLFENFWGCQEDHPGRMSEERAMRAQIRRYLYRHAVWGRSLQTWWYSYTTAGYLTSYNCNWLNPVYDLTTLRYSAAGLPVEKEKVDRLQGLLLNSEIVPSRLLVIQPYDTMLAQGRGSEAWSEWMEWHDLLFPRNLLYEVLPDIWFADGRVSLRDFDVVILPIATHLDPRFSAKLIDFIRQGGTCITSGPCGIYDHLGHENGDIMSAAQPKLTTRCESKPDEDWRYSYGVQANADGLVETSVGQGKLFLLPESVTAFEDGGRALSSLIRSKVAPAVEARGTKLELLLRKLMDGRHLLCALNRDPDRRTTGEVVINGAFRQVADIDISPPFPIRTEVEDGQTRFRVTLDAGATSYFLLAGIQKLP
ncbi:MAG: beta-galactosidase, partial [Planctomycetota bacterium]|nr:beta-galactosidase [Planctomycetota bacterium]